MASDPVKEAKARELQDEQLIAYNDYDQDVRVISSLELWFREMWGKEGKVEPGRLVEFNRAPRLDANLTPDFVARFGPDYLLWGELKKSFGDEDGGSEKAQQIVKYAQYAPEGSLAGEPDGTRYDVLLLVLTESDDVAGQRIAKYCERKKIDPSQLAPIVIVGYRTEKNNVKQADWTILKWRKTLDGVTNHRFSEPNASTTGKPDLNELITEQPKVPIPLTDLQAVNTFYCPVTNDVAPGIYSATKLIIPALISDLLTDEERLDLRKRGSVTKTVTQNDVLRTDLIRPMNIRGRHLVNGLDWLVEANTARRIAKPGCQEYEVTIPRAWAGPGSKDLNELLAEKYANVKAQEIIDEKKRKQREEEKREKRRKKEEEKKRGTGQQDFLDDLPEGSGIELRT